MYIFSGEPSEKLDKDFEEVHTKTLAAVKESPMNPVRCHEMADLICAGMTQKRYEAYVIDGVYKGEWEREGEMPHSWVFVPGSLGRINGTILDYRFIMNNVLLQLGHWLKEKPEVVRHWRQKFNFAQRNIQYERAEGLEALAKELFPK